MTILHSDDVTALILAGGQGSRLGGQDKGLVEFQGKPLIEHVLERLQPQLTNIIINANRNVEKYHQYDYPVISDKITGFQGPLAGIEAGLSIATTACILTLPCDGPFVPMDLVSRMIDAKNNAQAVVAVAHDGEYMQSVYALIPLFLLDNLCEFLQEGNRKVGQWLQQQKPVIVDFSDQKNAFANINTESQKSSWE